MESNKIDRTKLRSAKSYAKMSGISIQHVYRLMKNKTLKTILIDDIRFIHL